MNQPSSASDGASDDSLMAEESQTRGVTAIFLAAGSSKRFGPDNKLLAIREGRPLVHHALDSVLRSTVERLIVVLGYEAMEVKAQCIDLVNNTTSDTPKDIEFVFNSDFESGMAGSLKAGVSRLLSHNSKQSDSQGHAALIFLADMPLIKPQTIDALINVMKKTPASRLPEDTADIACAFVPTYEHLRGNPVLLMPALLDLLLDVDGDVGARHLLKANPHVVREVPVLDEGIFADCDTTEQLEH